MKKTILKLICGAAILSTLGILCGSTSTLAISCEDSSLSVEECEGGPSGKNTKTNSETEIAPTFSTELNENERSVKFKFGHNLLLTGNNLASNLENKSGMVFAAGNNLSLSTIAEYGFIAGNTINFSGETVRDLYIAGNTITLTKDAKIGRDVFMAGNVLNVNTNINGDLAVSAAELVLKDVKIAGNLDVDVSKLEFVGNVEIAGTITYADNTEVIGLDNATYGGLNTYHVEEVDPAAEMTARVYGVVMSGIGLFLTIALICALCPRMHDHIEKESTPSRFGINLAIGLGVLIGVPAVAIFLLCTILAAPVAVVIIVLYLVAIYLSQAFAGAWLGHIVLEKLCRLNGNIFIEAIVGIILLNALSLVPYVGTLTGLLGLLLGLGLIVGFLKPSSQKAKAADKASKKNQAKAED